LDKLDITYKEFGTKELQSIDESAWVVSKIADNVRLAAKNFFTDNWFSSFLKGGFIPKLITANTFAI